MPDPDHENLLHAEHPSADSSPPPVSLTSSAEITSRGESIKFLAADIKVAHSIFALPFALWACFMVRNSNDAWITFAVKLILVVACMVAARSVAMLANRILDRNIDAANPRTKTRAVASGKVALRDAFTILVWAAASFLIICVVFGFAFDNWWPLLLALPILAWISAYPLLKRFTWWCHAYLGFSLAISPLAAALAVEPAGLFNTPALWYLAGMVLAWVAGFDIIYALQDLEIDRAEKLSSIPARFGYSKALWISRLFHLISVAFLTAVTYSDDRLQTPLFFVVIGAVVLLLLIEHTVTAKHGIGRIQLTFFLLNGIISCLLGTAGIISIQITVP